MERKRGDVVVCVASGDYGSRLGSTACSRLRRDFMAASLLLIAAAATACGPAPASSTGIASVLLFTGTGTSPNDVAAMETILRSSHLSYSTANSFQLNSMAESQISRYRLFHLRHEADRVKPETNLLLQPSPHRLENGSLGPGATKTQRVCYTSIGSLALYPALVCC